MTDALIESFIEARPELAESKKTMLRYLASVSDGIRIEPMPKGRSRIHCEFDCGAYKGSEIVTFNMQTINPLRVALSLMALTSGHHFSYEKAEKVLELAGSIPAIQSKIDILTSKVEKMKMISPEDYVECENCGLLVNKNKSQVFSSVEEKRESGIYLYFTLSGTEQHFEKEAVLHHLCPHCDMKKFKKEKKY